MPTQMEDKKLALFFFTQTNKDISQNFLGNTINEVKSKLLKLINIY